MPHTIVEHSFSIPKPQIDSLLLLINQSIAKNEGGFNIYKCTARSALRENFIIGNRDIEKDFMHITLKIMEGRSLEIRQDLSKNILKLTEDFLHSHNLSIHPITLSVDIVQIIKETYQTTMISRINL